MLILGNLPDQIHLGVFKVIYSLLSQFIQFGGRSLLNFYNDGVFETTGFLGVGGIPYTKHQKFKFYFQLSTLTYFLAGGSEFEKF